MGPWKNQKLTDGLAISKLTVKKKKSKKKNKEFFESNIWNLELLFTTQKKTQFLPCSDEKKKKKKKIVIYLILLNRVETRFFVRVF